MGVNGDILGVAHYSVADQTETELVFDIHADLVGRRADRTVYNMFLRAQQLVSGDDRNASVLWKPEMHHIRYMPDEDHRPTDFVP